MSITVTPTESGNYSVQTSHESLGRRGVYPDAAFVDDLTGRPAAVNNAIQSRLGDDYSNWDEAIDDDDLDSWEEIYNDEPLAQPGVAPLPLNPQASEEAVAAYWLTPGISESDLQVIQQAYLQLSGSQAEQVADLLAFKMGALSLDELAARQPSAVEELMDLSGQQGRDYKPQRTEEQDEPTGDAFMDLAHKLDIDQLEELQAGGEELVQVAQHAAADLTSAEPQAALASSLMEQAESAYSSGQFDESFLYALSSRFHAGSVGAQAAILEAVKKMGYARAVQAYKNITTTSN